MNRLKLLVLGASGLMGRHLCAAAAGWDVVARTRSELDIRDGDKLAALLDRERPAWVVNAAAICNFDRCEDDPELSRAVHLEAPLRMAELCRERGIRLCQFSSDYIFDGRARVPYGEEDEPRPLSVYGRHKAEMEAGLRSFEEHLVARVAWVFGCGGTTFMSRLPDLLMREREVRVAAGKRGSCLYAGYGAELVLRLMERGAGGLVNVVHSGDTGWEEFAELCLARLRARGLEPACERVVQVPFQQIAALRPGRPDYSVLSVNRLAGLLGEPPARWETGLERFLDECGDEG